jgi:hypothetical protein
MVVVELVVVVVLVVVVDQALEIHAHLASETL